MAVKKSPKPTDKEIIIDVPFALSLAVQGAGWPLAAIQVSVHPPTGIRAWRADERLGWRLGWIARGGCVRRVHGLCTGC